MGAYGSPELLPKEYKDKTTYQKPNQKYHIKPYKPDDNIPMTYFYIYIFVKFPINMLIPVIMSFFTWLSSAAMLVSTICLIAEAIICIGLYSKRKWGYTANRIYIIISIVRLIPVILLYIVYFVLDSNLTFLFGTLYLLVSLGIHIFSYVYFEKRRLVFDK